MGTERNAKKFFQRDLRSEVKSTSMQCCHAVGSYTAGKQKDKYRSGARPSLLLKHFGQHAQSDTSDTVLAHELRLGNLLTCIQGEHGRPWLITILFLQCSGRKLKKNDKSTSNVGELRQQREEPL